MEERPESKVTLLPPAGREEQYERWGITPDRVGARRRDELLVDAPDDDPTDAEALDFLCLGGWHAVTVTEGGGRSGGMTSHRGVLHPEDYVDPATLQSLVEDELGFTYEAVRSVYRQGPLNHEQRELRAAIDARVLALSASGANLAQLGRALGFPVKDNGNCRAMGNALARARKESA